MQWNLNLQRGYIAVKMMMQVHPQGIKKIQIQASTGTKTFVPMRSGQKKISKKEDVAGTTLEVLNLMKDVVKNDPTKELIELMRSEMAQTREQEMNWMARSCVD